MTGGQAWRVVGVCVNFSIHHDLFPFTARLGRERYCPHSMGEEARTPDRFQGSSDRKFISLPTLKHDYHKQLFSTCCMQGTVLDVEGMYGRTST